ncbi:MAG: Rap1a/Tai family immunity protein [Sphingomonadaceae bacterium]
MKRIFIGMFAASIAAVSSPGLSQDIVMSMNTTGNDLYARCTAPAKNKTGNADFSFCQGYIFAASDYYATMAANTGSDACYKTGATNGQLVDLTIKYLQDNPGERHRPANFAVMAVIGQLFGPCAVPQR